MIKSGADVFRESELVSFLKNLEIDKVVVAGFAAEYCVLSTYHEAIERGYQATILQDAVASVENNQRTKYVPEISESISLGDLKEQFD
ncbi:MAG: cysteine hydrolase [Anaerolineales bacterium]|nr:cysteine hydrolase [Anaerolineales bacterium]